MITFATCEKIHFLDVRGIHSYPQLYLESTAIGSRSEYQLVSTTGSLQEVAPDRQTFADDLVNGSIRCATPECFQPTLQLQLDW
jgi:hypothetical protein